MTARPTTNVLLTGVGGQGVGLASFVLSHVAMEEGYDVKQSEVHGMSQRGGSVTSHFRFGDKVWSPLVSPGTADILMALEALEGLRYVNWLKPGGVLVYNALRVNPSPVSAGLATYPAEIDRLIKEGIYARVRHPIYSADITLALGIFIMMGELRFLLAAAWLTLVMFYWMRLEERGLTEKFGKEYSDYMNEVPMFCPSLGKRPGKI